MAEPLNFTEQKKVFVTDAITPNQDGNIAIQVTFEDSEHHSIIYLVSIDGTNYTTLGRKEVQDGGLCHITGLMQGESIKVMCRQKPATAYVLH